MKKLSIIMAASFALSGCAAVQYVGEAAWETKHRDECQISPQDPIGQNPPGCYLPTPLEDDDKDTQY